MDIMRQTACMVVTPSMVDNFAYLLYFIYNDTFLKNEEDGEEQSLVYTCVTLRVLIVKFLNKTISSKHKTIIQRKQSEVGSRGGSRMIFERVQFDKLTVLTLCIRTDRL